MAGTIEKLMKIKEEALDSIPTLTEEELFHFNEFLIDLLSAVNREMLYLLIEKYNNYERRNDEDGAVSQYRSSDE